MDQASSRFGLSLNCSLGKSEVMILLAGTGSKEQRKDIFVNGSQLIPCLRATGNWDNIRVLAQYKHLGTQSSVSDTMHPEIVARVGALKGGLETPQC